MTHEHNADAFRPVEAFTPSDLALLREHLQGEHGAVIRGDSDEGRGRFIWMLHDRAHKILQPTERPIIAAVLVIGNTSQLLRFARAITDLPRPVGEICRWCAHEPHAADCILIAAQLVIATAETPESENQ
jgi:hypothetical protein